MNLLERHEDYESLADIKLLKNLPVIIKSSIRNYKKVIQELERPYCFDFAKLMAKSILFAIGDIPDCIFAYYFNDEIILILRNDLGDNDPWNQNNIQKVSTTVASLLTAGFMKFSYAENLNLTGDVIFASKAFILPSLTEVVNYLIMKQNTALDLALDDTLYFELSNKLNKFNISDIINYSFEDKIRLLFEYCDINFIEDFPSSFLNGIGIYKIPVVLKTQDGIMNKKKWHIAYDLPEFVKHKDFILNIVKNGSDIFRVPDIKNLME